MFWPLHSAEVHILKYLLQYEIIISSTVNTGNCSDCIRHNSTWDDYIPTADFYIVCHGSLSKWHGIKEERHCYFLDEKKLANYLLYTSTNCIDECIMERTVNACDCVTFEMYQSTVNKKPYCANLTCADNVRSKYACFSTQSSLGLHDAKFNFVISHCSRANWDEGHQILLQSLLSELQQDCVRHANLVAADPNGRQHLEE